MTFKHTDFDSSPTMRSLTKLAREKGLIKDEPVVKTAAPKVDLTPSDSLTENLLKLCTGLRAAGFDKHAEEVESKFVQYKQATSMYGVGDEKGEDLVHAAHPKGSHKMEDIDSKEATFEDILDKHLQFLNVVDSKPTGKLGSTQDVINAVKVALGARPLSVKKDPKVSLGQAAQSSVGVGAGVAAGVGGSVVLWAAIKIVNAIGRVFGNMTQAYRLVGIKNIAELSSKSDAELAKVIAESLSKVGPKAAAEVIKDVGPQVVKAAGPEVEQLALNLGGEAAVSGGEAAVGLIPEISGLGAAGLGAAFVAGATVAYLATSAIYEHSFYVTELGDAGKKLQDDLTYLKTEQNWQDKHSLELAFNSSLTAVLNAGDAAKNIMQNPAPSGLKAIQDYASNLQDASNNAYKLSAAARTIFTGDEHMTPGTSKSDEGMMGYLGDQVQTSPIGRLMGKMTPGASKAEYSDVIISGANFVNVAQRALIDVRTAIQHILSMKKDQSSPASGVAQQLIQKFDDALQSAALYKARVNARALPNAADLNDWLDNIALKWGKQWRGEFAQSKFNSDPDLITSYTNKYNNLKWKLDAFQQKWLS